MISRGGGYIQKKGETASTLNSPLESIGAANKRILQFTQEKSRVLTHFSTELMMFMVTET